MDLDGFWGATSWGFPGPILGFLGQGLQLDGKHLHTEAPVAGTSIAENLEFTGGRGGM